MNMGFPDRQWSSVWAVGAGDIKPEQNWVKLHSIKNKGIICVSLVSVAMLFISAFRRNYFYRDQKNPSN